ncbi:hypothetical protein NB636_03650 [Oxalobacter aliiformigenes]|uniref:hypothetical protein n=1 Tax=Oxalobacter aliiformigenes TaxID=2946593 RepID=UPI0022AFC1B1|nr:hypothetical protein [Oxalobacter aliiformigenes]MCZ4064720.1 hypothetical protein [Oxalobacter aliiformigenes]WAV99952.1 hypothetical protein NB636_03650 [Oxalobacter aliiformigenes]
MRGIPVRTAIFGRFHRSHHFTTQNIPDGLTESGFSRHQQQGGDRRFFPAEIIIRPFSGDLQNGKIPVFDHVFRHGIGKILLIRKPQADQSGTGIFANRLPRGTIRECLR